MDRLIFGMHHLNITQAGSLLDGKEHYSHPNAAIDLAGEDSGIDYWYNKESDTCFYCSGYFGNRATGNTRFFVSCDSTGQKKKVLCADGKERVVTIAMTHSSKDYRLYHVYKPGDILYQEGTAGRATGNHIHLEVAEGSQKTKYWDVKMKVYRMMGEMDPRNAFFILDGFTKVVNTQGLIFKHCTSVKVEEKPMGLGFKAHRAETQKIIDAHKKDFNADTVKSFLASKGGYKAYLKSLGGVFAKYVDFTGKITTYDQLSEIGDYVWGLYDIWGVDYSNGCSYTYKENIYKAYAIDGSQFYTKEDPKARFKMNYSAFSFANGEDLPGIDEMLSNPDRYYAVTNCGQGVVQTLKKAGLCPKSFPDPAEYPAYWKSKGYSYTLIKSTKDLRVGDVLYFFNKPLSKRATRTTISNWESGGFHTAIVGEMTSNGYILYDSGHAYTYYGEFRNPRKFSDKPYQWAEDWIGLRFDFGLSEAPVTGWRKQDGKWYFYNNGKKLTGWHKIKWSKGTDWFYFDKNGAMLTGWQKLKWSKGENWFYFTPDGAMVTGVQYLEWKGKTDWYVFDNDGAMLTGTIKMEVKLDSSGRMLSLSTAKIIK